MSSLSFHVSEVGLFARTSHDTTRNATTTNTKHTVFISRRVYVTPSYTGMRYNQFVVAFMLLAFGHGILTVNLYVDPRLFFKESVSQKIKRNDKVSVTP